MNDQIKQKVEQLTGDRKGDRAIRQSDIRATGRNKMNAQKVSGSEVSVKDFNALVDDVASLKEMLRKASA